MRTKQQSKLREKINLDKTYAKLVLVLGGASSGKSEFALKMAGTKKPRALVATGEPLDAEMAKRIRAHQQSRRGGWETCEVPVEVADWFDRQASQYSMVVLDCLTLWLSNLLRARVRARQVSTRTKELVRAARRVSGSVIVVSNELGLGLVPGDAMSRQFRDLSGKVNQIVATAADEVYFVASGLPLRLK